MAVTLTLIEKDSDNKVDEAGLHQRFASLFEKMYLF
jgi:hypothetical protein